MTVVPFTPKEPHIFICGCGCASFLVNDDLNIECCICGNVNEGEFVRDDLKRKVNSERDTAGIRTINLFGDINSARRSVLKGFMDGQDKMLLLAGIFDDEATSSWCGATTKMEASRIADLLRGLADQLEMRNGYEAE